MVLPSDDRSGFGRASQAGNSSHNERRERRLRRSSDLIMQQAEAFVASLEMIGDGVILLDGDTHVVFASENAHSILREQKEHIQIAGNRLRFADSRIEPRLKAVIAQIKGDQKAASRGSMLAIERVTPHPPLVLSLFPLPQHEPEEPSTPRMMVVLRDPENVPAPQWQVFAQHFQLSAAETRVCLALADGLSLVEYSEKYHISPHTARTHLKGVFAKTATRRQADLLRLIFAFTRL